MEHNHDTENMDSNHDHDMHMGHSDGNCNIFQNLPSLLWIFINILILLSTIPIIFVFLKRHFKKHSIEKQPAYLFYSALLFVFTTLVILVADTISIFFYECSHMWWMMFMLIFGFAYTMQILLVLIIFLSRVHFCF